MRLSNRFLHLVAASLLFLAPCRGEEPKAADADVVAKLCQHVQKRQKMVVDKSQAEIVWSDGAILEIGKSFPAPLQELIAKPMREQDIRSFLQQLDSGNAAIWKTATIVDLAKSETRPTIKSSDGTISVKVENVYVDYLKQRYPSAAIRIKGEMAPILFMVDGQLKASVMPMK